jgi:hypothetical protein
MFNKNKDKKEKKGLFYQMSGAKHINSAFGVTKDMVQGLRSKKAQNYQSETIESALERFNIPKTEWTTHLLKFYNNYKLSFIILSTASVLFFVLGVLGNFMHGHIGSGILYIAILFAVISVILNNSFRCYQVRRYLENGVNELGGLNEFFRSPKEWFPRKIKLNK